MKKRVFYVVNLDRSRIWILALLLVSTLLFAFATGFRVGQAQTPTDRLHESGDSLDSLDSARRLDRDEQAFGSGSDEAQTGDLELAELRSTTGSLPDGARNSGDALDADESLSRLDSQNDDRVGASPFEKNPDNRPVHLANVAPRETRSPAPQTRKASSKSVSKQTAPKPAKKSVKTKTEKKSSKQTASKQSAPAKKKQTTASKATAPVSKKQLSAKSSPASSTNPRSALLDAKGSSLRLANPSSGNSSSKSQTQSQKQPVKKQSASANRSYSLQLGAFSSRSAADRMAGSLKQQGFHPRVEKSRGRHIVRVGKSDTAKGLWKLEKGLRAKKYAPMRVRTGGQ